MFSIKSFRLAEQVNPAYIDAYEADEREANEKTRKRYQESGKAEFLVLLAILGRRHLNEKEVVNFNLSTESFEPEILHHLINHLTDCFRCRARCRRLSYDDPGGLSERIQ